jgi:AcrR family transcriptional regulator
VRYIDARSARRQPDASEKPSGPRSRKGVETRARLLAAAKEVFEQDGFLDARISDIAERAGLSHGSFYHYFESKEEVFREVAAEVEQRLSEPLYSVILDAHPPPQARTSGSTKGSGGTSRATGTKPASWV